MAAPVVVRASRVQVDSRCWGFKDLGESMLEQVFRNKRVGSSDVELRERHDHERKRMRTPSKMWMNIMRAMRSMLMICGER